MRILVGYDGSEQADAALEGLTAAGLTGSGEARFVCVADEGWQAVKGGTTEQHNEGFATPWAEHLHEAEGLAAGASAFFQATFPGWTCSAEGLWGSAPKAILKTVESMKPDLLVIGSHGRSAVARLVL